MSGEVAWSEDALHRWLATLSEPPGRAAGAMHDAATLDESRGQTVVCVDQCIEGVHFTSDQDGAAAGAKAVLRTFSDLAATAARPRAVTLAIRAPHGASEERLRAVILGARSASESLGAGLVAGDLAKADGPLGLSVTAVGSLEAPWPPPDRARARPGDAVLVSGPLGGSLQSGRHLRPVPRIEAGIRAAQAGAHALMDVSDGLAWDLFRLARTAAVRVDLDLQRVPIHADALSQSDPLHGALHDGEDHELIAAVPAEHLAAHPEAFDGWTRVGAVSEGSGLVLLDPGASVENQRRPWTPGEGGWQHNP